MIESLRRKPRALLRAQLQNDLLPTERWRQLWRQLLAALPPDEAAKVMVDALHVAARTDDLSGVERYLRRQLSSGDLSLTALREHYSLRPPRGLMALPQLQIPENHLSSDDELMGRDRYDLLVIDDIGYVRKDEAETSVLFELVMHRYERRSLLVTSNQPFSEWENVFSTSAMTVAAVDRLVDHSTIVHQWRELPPQTGQALSALTGRLRN